VNNSTPEIVYIVGSGRSGSTLVDMVLGAHSAMFSLGEIISLLDYIKEDKECACRKKFHQCPFWKDVISEFSLQWGVDLIKDPEMLDLKIIDRGNRSRFGYLIEIGSRIIDFKPKHSSRRTNTDREIIERAHEFYDLVRKKSDTKILIDSSKSIRRSLRLSWNRPEDSFRLIFLVRDGRGVVHSRRKREIIVDEPQEVEGEIRMEEIKRPAIHPSRSMLRYITAWLQVNLSTYLGLLTIPRRNWMILKYEDLCHNPEMTLQRVCEFLNLDYEAGMIDFRLAAHHNIDGNPVRFRSGGIKIPDEKWRTGLNSTDRLLFGSVAGWLNYLFGYK